MHTLEINKISLTKKGWKCTVYLSPIIEGDTLYATILKPTVREVLNELDRIGRDNKIITYF